MADYVASLSDDKMSLSHTVEDFSRKVITESNRTVSLKMIVRWLIQKMQWTSFE